jgi:lipoate-protein ligase A
MQGEAILAWWDEPALGALNMAADEVLAAEAARQGRVLVRFYGWSEATFSLGGFQPVAAAEAAADIASLPLVRRPSGGGGIVHGSDLTYAVAVPRQHPWGQTSQVLYDAFHEALAGVLGERGIAASLHSGRPDRGGDESRLFCFDRRARGDLVVPGPTPAGHKILGSAQRRLQAAVLQHGSLLLERPREVGPAAAHPGLRELCPAAGRLEPRDLAAAWLERLAATTATAAAWAAGGFAPANDAAIAAAAARFSDPAWLRRR